MSADPTAIQQMLMSSLQQPPATATAGGGSGGPQMQSQTSPLNAAATLAQKAMLMRALQTQQQNQQVGQFNQNQPGLNAQMANDPTMQGLQQTPQIQMDPATLQQLQGMPQIAPLPGDMGQ